PAAYSCPAPPCETGDHLPLSCFRCPGGPATTLAVALVECRPERGRPHPAAPATSTTMARSTRSTAPSSPSSSVGAAGEPGGPPSWPAPPQPPGAVRRAGSERGDGARSTPLGEREARWDQRRDPTPSADHLTGHLEPRTPGGRSRRSGRGGRSARRG